MLFRAVIEDKMWEVGVEVLYMCDIEGRVHKSGNDHTLFMENPC